MLDADRAILEDTHVGGVRVTDETRDALVRVDLEQ
jgi:hypothetical protein